MASLCLAVSLCLPPCHAEEQADTNRTMRIGLVNALGQDEYAYRMLRNYIFVYLDEISKQTHWQYEYHAGTLEECREKLLGGELDFVVPVQYNAATDDGMLFSPSFPSYGLLGLYAMDSNLRMDVNDAGTMNGTTIGLVENQAVEHALRYYIDDNSWQLNVVEFSSSQELLAALLEGRLDAVVDDGTHVSSTERRLSSFAVFPEQIMTTAQNAHKLNELTEAVLDSRKTHPSFETWLKSAYLDLASRNIIHYTEAEQEFIKKSPALRVVFLPAMLPLFDASGEDMESARGIYVDLLRLIANTSGLKFDLKQAASRMEVWERLQNGEADLAFVVYSNGRFSHEMFFTNHCRQEEISAVIRRDDGGAQLIQGTIAVPLSFSGIMSFWQEKGIWKIQQYNTVEACLDAVEDGECDITLVPSLYLQRENCMLFHPALTVNDDLQTRIPVSLAIAPAQPQILQTILNKSLLSVTEEQMAHIVQKNATPRFSFGYLLAKYPLSMTLSLCVFLVGVCTTAFLFFRSRMQKKQNLQLMEKNDELEHALRAVEHMRISRDSYKLESETDKLTGLFNKVAMERFCRERLEQLREGDLAALYVLDLDHFKEANDTYGHQYGDNILQEFALALKKLFRSNDLIGRFGGDEFVVMIMGVYDKDVVERKAEEIMHEAHNLYIGGERAKITSSIGIAFAPWHGRTYENLFQSADQALYQVKTHGRDGFCICEEEALHYSPA